MIIDGSVPFSSSNSRSQYQHHGFSTYPNQLSCRIPGAESCYLQKLAACSSSFPCCQPFKQRYKGKMHIAIATTINCSTRDSGINFSRPSQKSRKLILDIHFNPFCSWIHSISTTNSHVPDNNALYTLDVPLRLTHRLNTHSHSCRRQSHSSSLVHLALSPRLFSRRSTGNSRQRPFGQSYNSYPITYHPRNNRCWPIVHRSFRLGIGVRIRLDRVGA